MLLLPVDIPSRAMEYDPQQKRTQNQLEAQRSGFKLERKMEMTDMELYRRLRKPVKRNGVSFKIAGKYAGNRLLQQK